MKKLASLSIFLLAVMLYGCGPKTPIQESNNKFDQDDRLIKIYDLQDRRLTDSLIPFLKAKKESHRVQAALAFASIQDSAAIPYLSQMIQTDQSELPRRAAALALGQIGSSKVTQVLRQAFASETSKINQRYILEAIGKCIDSSSYKFLLGFETTDSTLQMGWMQAMFRALLNRMYNPEGMYRVESVLRGENPLEIKRIAAHYIYRYYKLNPNYKQAYLENLISTQVDPEIIARLNEIYPKMQEERILNDSFVKQYEQANVYRQSQMLLELNAPVQNVLPYLYQIITNTNAAIVVRNSAFEQYRKLALDLEGTKISNLVSYGLRSGNMSLQSIACYAIVEDSFSYEHQNVYIEILDSTINSLDLPRQFETFIDMKKAMAKLGSAEYIPMTMAYDHPIDWSYVKSIPQMQKVLIETNKGNIVIACDVNGSPGSVSNFLKLVDENFYNDKYFHRVVANFVIQGGCPRGDGWGSLDWNQRSEFSNYNTYTKGAVGLASSGNDTEGVQFFITHCSTPHLDGRYTIFAYVVEGMDVVNKIEVGDKIISVARIKPAQEQVL